MIDCQTNLILLYILCALILLLFIQSTSEGFASERAQEIYDNTVKYFNKKSHAYSDVRDSAKIDFVEYSAVRDLWKKGGLNPDAIDTFVLKSN